MSAEDTAERIARQRDIETMVACDNAPALAARVRNLLTHGRRIAVTTIRGDGARYLDFVAGCTVTDIKDWIRPDGSAGITVRLSPGLTHFGFGARAHEHDTEHAETMRYYATPDRHTNMIRIRIVGGCTPGDGPSRGDQITIWRWNSEGFRTIVAVTFDPDTGTQPGLATIRNDLRAHLANLADKQPWENADLLERTLAALDTHTCGT